MNAIPDLLINDEFTGERKSAPIMDLHQLPDGEEASSICTLMIMKLQKFLEGTFSVKATDKQIEVSNEALPESC